MSLPQQVSISLQNFSFTEDVVVVITDLLFLSCTHLSLLSPENANEEEKREFMDEIELITAWKLKFRGRFRTFYI